jgi:hypothetical protein
VHAVLNGFQVFGGFWLACTSFAWWLPILCPALPYWLCCHQSSSAANLG